MVQYAEDSQRHNHQSWMVLPKTVNGLTIQVNGYAEDSQRLNHQSWMVMPKTVNGLTIQV
jgi:hypothetical protein